MDILALGQNIEGTCCDYSSDGKGVVKYQGYIIFVTNLLLNEEAVIQIKYKRAGIYYGEIQQIIVFSSDRTKGICDICAACGGCCFGKLCYEKTLEYKENKLKRNFKLINEDLSKIHVQASDEPLFYRNKIVIQARTIQGKRMLGFFREGSHEIINLNTCSISQKPLNFLWLELKKLILASSISFFDDKTFKGTLRGLQIKYSSYSQELLLCLIVTKYQSSDPHLNALISEINKLRSSFHLAGLIINVNDLNNNLLLGSKDILLWGRDLLRQNLSTLKFNISNHSFFQVNTKVAEKLFFKAIELANLKSSDLVLDAFCGVGCLACLVAPFVQKVIGVEIVEDAIINAKDNARLNNLANTDFIVDDCTNYLEKQEASFDCIFVDPPRKGLDSKFITSLLANKAPKIIYISCDPATLVRDLKILQVSYEIKNIQGFDMFSYTSHVECVCELVLKDK
ncbi:MAG: 23S rRNA (uracil(1939)-C(5))-methyltransferase RlmD [Acholeplasmatales bacterium]|jgi:23S rRNA (uracil1939-C5)-methyltransferase|nr:23S rRNA (uracil(1939)-C(5))-methyltransferase RlmD [Acholeplasmatales bacterium]